MDWGGPRPQHPHHPPRTRRCLVELGKLNDGDDGVPAAKTFGEFLDYLKTERGLDDPAINKKKRVVSIDPDSDHPAAAAAQTAPPAVRRRLPMPAAAPAAAAAAPAADMDAFTTAMAANIRNLKACYEYLKNDNETLVDFVSRRSGYEAVANPKFADMATIARANGESKAVMMHAMAGLPDHVRHDVVAALDKKCTENMHALA